MVKSFSLTEELPPILGVLNIGEGNGIPGVAVKCLDIGRTPVAKAVAWPIIDAHGRKRGDQTGLDTPVVHALNDGYSVLARKGRCLS